MNPPHFDNEWIPFFMMYSQIILWCMLRNHRVMVIERAGRKLGMREWLTSKN